MWEQQDKVLLTWLQSMLSMLILSRVLGCAHSYKVWKRIHDYFHKQTWATARQLQTELRSMTLGVKSMHEYLSQITAIYDSLASVGSPIMLQEHIDSILEGPSLNYHPPLLKASFNHRGVTWTNVCHHCSIHHHTKNHSVIPKIASLQQK